MPLYKDSGGGGNADRLFLPAPHLRETSGGGASEAAWDTHYHAWSLPAVGYNALGGWTDLDMSGWATTDVHVWWAPSTANAGGVMWQLLVETAVTDGEDTGGVDITPSGGATSPGVAGRVQKFTLASGAAWNIGGEDTLVPVSIRRMGDHASDDYPDAALLLGVELRKAS